MGLDREGLSLIAALRLHSPVLEAEFDSDAVQRFLTEMPRALATYGTPAHRLEEAMALAAERLGVNAEFFSMPTAVLCAIGEGDQTRSHMVRVAPGEVNLEKLDRVDDILGRVLAGELRPRAALAEMDAVRAGPDRYGPVLTVACFGLAAAGAGTFFGGSWPDHGVSALLGLVVGLIALFARTRRQTARVTDFLSGVVCASGAMLAGRWVGGVTPSVVIISSLIVLVPGLTLTVAINELATKNLVSGTARLMGAVMILLSIGFGVALGQALVPSIAVTSSAGAAAPDWARYAAVGLVPLALTVLFRARFRDALVIVPVAAAGYVGARQGARLMGPELGAWAGAFAVGMLGNLRARVADRPTAVTLVPGIMLLVPGAIGFSSVSSFMARDVVAGVQTAFSVVIMATGIVIGLLLANVLLPPRQSL
jgi:uncharacterized membrane protein YjjP (DUF1212 family)